MFEGPGPRVFTITSGAAFVDVLAARLIGLAGGEPLALAEMRVLLPTRRACRALAEAFLRAGGGDTVLLPRLLPLGDMDEEELTIAEAGLGADAAADTPPEIPGLRRQLLLTRAVMALPDHALQPAQAAALALELAKLIDRLATEDCDPAGLRTLVAEDYAAHWQEVLRFLNILIDVWPDILAGEGALDPAARRNALLRAQARLWRETPPATPVIAAGSTGSIPATAELLDVVAGLPRGAVILPGLDRDLDDGAWDLLGPTHPQFGLKQLLGRLGVDRRAVAAFDRRAVAAFDQDPATPAADTRARVLAAALRPAAAPPLPPPATDDIAGALAGVQRLDCPGPAEEAAAVALVMRQALETPGRTCALVTPDRGLARRVQAQLQRWEVEVDDSAGRPLAATPPGAFLRLVADAAREKLAPVPLLAVLKHPLAAGGMAAAEFRSLVRLLETEALRGPRPGPGLAGLQKVLPKGARGARLKPLIDVCARTLGPLARVFEDDGADYGTLLRAHVEAAEALAASDGETGAARLWAEDAGEAAAGFVAELADALGALGPGPAGAYPQLFERLMEGRVVRPRFGAHPRLFIWGLLEARLQHADTVILGGLNEETWPPAPETNPWMSRPMMAAIGLEPPERRLGLTAHDFQQAFAAPEVILSRAERVGGAPTVPSRWLSRLDNLLARAGLDPKQTLAPADPWLGWVAALDRIEHRPPAPPRPCPPAEARPRGLSVTQIETLIRDPYAVYARHVLNLKPLDPLDADPGAAERGTIVHAALERFIRTYPDTVPDDAERRLLEIGRDVFADMLTRPGVRAFWWPRFERIAHWFVAWQRARLAEGWRTAFAEKTATMTLDAVRGGFTLTAKPDRIDHLPGSGLAILDYKTGQTPTAPQVESGLSPQLPLEAAMALAGAFEGVPKDDVAQLVYVRLSGGRTPGEAAPLKLDVPAVIEKSAVGLNRLIVRFADAKTPYLSRPRPQFESRFGDYDHLARVAAWHVIAGDDE